MLKVVSPFVVQEARNAENIAIETMRHSPVAFRDRPGLNTLPLLRLPLAAVIAASDTGAPPVPAEGNHAIESARTGTIRLGME